MTKQLPVPPKILLVDDDHRLVKTCTTTFEHAGFKVFSATSRVAALDTLSWLAPDLIVLDVSLADDIDAGFELCQLIRSGLRDNKHVVSAQVLILMLTARNSLEERQRGLEAGANRYLTKPIRSTVLVQEIVDLLQHAAQMRGKLHDAAFDKADYFDSGG